MAAKQPTGGRLADDAKPGIRDRRVGGANGVSVHGRGVERGLGAQGDDILRENPAGGLMQAQQLDLGRIDIVKQARQGLVHGKEGHGQRSPAR